ncbi:hypothetical protein FRC10_001063 [Ceratobasidium sp. 414]|nr:hypothetical protein FRC10_001063 [Ceratobasidium sp. 414]
MDRIPVRVEDVVYTLNNILDDIGWIYADTPNSSFMEGVLHPATMSAPPAEDLGSDSDSSSLESRSTSPNPSPASSGFTSPSTSPTPSGFLFGENEGTPPDRGDVGQPVVRATGSSDVQLHTSQPDPPELNLANVDRLSSSHPTTLLPSSLAATSEFGLPSSSNQYSDLSLNFLPELQFDPLCFPSREKGDSNTTHKAPDFTNAQFINGSESPQASNIKHMPGISPLHLTVAPPRLPPRPSSIYTSACNASAYIPALRSPALPSTPNLEQSQHWTNWQRGQAEGREVSATYLVRQRQRVRMTITRAASLPEPRDLPVYRPQSHHLDSYPLAGPLRSRTGAYNRRVNVAPRVLGKSWWDPWRKGGILDRAALADNRRRLRMLDAFREEKTLEAADEAEVRSTKGTKSVDANVPNDQAEDEVYDGVPLVSHQEAKDAEQGGSYTTQAAQDEALLMATLIASLDPGPCLDPGSSDDASAHGLCPDESTGQNSDTMQVYVEDGVLVTPSSEQTVDTSDTAPKDGISPRFPVRTTTTQHNKYTLRPKSPLSQSFVAPPPITRIHIPSVHEVEAEMLSAGRVWRKLTSMMF